MQQDQAFIVAAIVLGILLLALLVGSVAFNVREFAAELRRIDMELQRCEPEQQEKWLRRRRRLWLSLLPFVRY